VLVPVNLSTIGVMHLAPAQRAHQRAGLTGSAPLATTRSPVNERECAVEVPLSGLLRQSKVLGSTRVVFEPDDEFLEGGKFEVDRCLASWGQTYPRSSASTVVAAPTLDVAGGREYFQMSTKVSIGEAERLS
jgi:hypothetical protein